MERSDTVLVVQGRARVHMCPKVATSSISTALRGSGHHTASPDDDGPEPRFMAVRHPLDRLVSAWSFFCRGECPGDKDLRALGYGERMEWPEFLDLAIEKHDLNAHTRPQTHFAGPHHIDQLVPLSRLDHAWEGLRRRVPGVEPIIHKNTSSHTFWQAYYTRANRARTERVFSDDVELFERAQ